MLNCIAAIVLSYLNGSAFAQYILSLFAIEYTATKGRLLPLLVKYESYKWPPIAR